MTINITEQVEQVDVASQGSVQVFTSLVQVVPQADGSLIIQSNPLTVLLQQEAVSVQIPLVTVEVVDVGTQGPQGPPGQSGAAPIFYATNKDVVAFDIGQILATDPSGSGVVLASATDNTLNCVGLATIGVTPGLVETVQYGGIFSLNDWTAITGTVTIGPQLYYLATTPGVLTTVAPTTPGNAFQVIGRGVSGTQMELISGFGFQL